MDSLFHILIIYRTEVVSFVGWQMKLTAGRFLIDTGIGADIGAGLRSFRMTEIRRQTS